ncbi:15088_t:CDS:1, partial [Gigaspora margarita]
SKNEQVQEKRSTMFQEKNKKEERQVQKEKKEKQYRKVDEKIELWLDLHIRYDKVACYIENIKI